MMNSIFRLLPRKVSPITITQLSGISTSALCRKKIADPAHPNDLHRAGGIASFMRVPIAEPPKSEGELDVAFLGVPLDTATSNRPGARYNSVDQCNPKWRAVNQLHFHCTFTAKICSAFRFYHKIVIKCIVLLVSFSTY